MQCVKAALLLLLPLLLGACDSGPEEKQAPDAAKTFGIGKAMLPAFSTVANEDGQWLTPQKDYANTRFSGSMQVRKQEQSLPDLEPEREPARRP